MFQSGCGATVHQVDEFDIRKNNDRKKKVCRLCRFCNKGKCKKKTTKKQKLDVKPK